MDLLPLDVRQILSDSRVELNSCVKSDADADAAAVADDGRTMGRNQAATTSRATVTVETVVMTTAYFAAAATLRR